MNPPSASYKTTVLYIINMLSFPFLKKSLYKTYEKCKCISILYYCLFIYKLSEVEVCFTFFAPM